MDESGTRGQRHGAGIASAAYWRAEPASDAAARRVGLRALAVSYGLFATVAGRESALVLCPWRALTGRRCPLCGLTRAVRQAIRGHLTNSVRLHPAGPLATVALILCAVRGLRVTRYAAPHL
jgi:hypothetical protein